MMIHISRHATVSTCTPTGTHATRGARALAGTLTGLLALTTLSACTPTSNTDLTVVATTTQICDYVTQIALASPNIALNKTDAAGQNTHLGAAQDTAALSIGLTCLLAPNASAHEHEMTPAQTHALANANVMAVSGIDLEHFLDDAVTASGFHGRMIVTSGVLGSADIDDPQAQQQAEKDLPYTVDRGSEKVEVAPWPFPPENAGEQPEFRFDPHVWTSPKRARIQVHNLGDGLAAAAPAHADTLTAATRAYMSTLDDLDEWSRQAIATVPEENRVLFTSHDAFGYFSADYGIRFIGAALSDFNEQQDATAGHIAQAAQQVKDSGARALFAENSNNSKSVEAIARAAGVKAVIGDDALYGDSLGPDGSEGETYISSIIHNVRALTHAWDGNAPALPDSLTVANASAAGAPSQGNS